MKIFVSLALSAWAVLWTLAPMQDMPLLPLAIAVGLAAWALRIIIKTPPLTMGAKVVVALIVVLQGWVYFDIATRGTRLLLERLAL